MANEELTQRGYLASGKLKGELFGSFERFNIGATTVKELVTCGIGAVVPEAIDFPFSVYKPPKKPSAAKPVIRVKYFSVRGQLFFPFFERE
jgi:type I restriction enzyme M protein